MSIYSQEVEDLELEGLDDFSILDEVSESDEESSSADNDDGEDFSEDEITEDDLEESENEVAEEEPEEVEEVQEELAQEDKEENKREEQIADGDELTDQEILDDLDTAINDEIEKELDIEATDFASSTIDEENLSEELDQDIDEKSLDDVLDEFDQDNEGIADTNDLDEEDLDDEDKVLVETLAEKQQREKDFLDQLSGLREKNLENLVDEKVKKKKSRYTPAQVLAFKIQLKDIAKSPTRLAYIRKKTKMVDIKTDKIVLASRGVTVKAHTLTDADNFRYIVDKKGDIKYKVYVSDITNLNQITDLYHKPHYFTKVKVEKRSRNYNKNFDFSFKFNLHGGISSNQYTKNIIKGTENYAALLRTEATVLTDFDLPVKIGMSGVYETISGRLKGGGNFSTKVISLGPSIVKTRIYDRYDFIFQPRISIAASIAQRSGQDTSSTQLSDTSMLLGVERELDYKIWGKFVLGYNFQRKWLKPKAQNDGLSVATDTRYDDSFAISIGHRTNWLW